MESDGSSLKKARTFGPQFPNDFPDLLAKWPKRILALVEEMKGLLELDA